MVPISASNVKKSMLDLKQLIDDNLEALNGSDVLTVAQDVIVLANPIY